MGMENNVRLMMDSTAAVCYMNLGVGGDSSMAALFPWEHPFAF